jgi:hypothetical protein
MTFIVENSVIPRHSTLPTDPDKRATAGTTRKAGARTRTMRGAHSPPTASRPDASVRIATYNVSGISARLPGSDGVAEQGRAECRMPSGAEGA